MGDGKNAEGHERVREREGGARRIGTLHHLVTAFFV